MGKRTPIAVVKAVFIRARASNTAPYGVAGPFDNRRDVRRRPQGLSHRSPSLFPSHHPGAQAVATRWTAMDRTPPSESRASPGRCCLAAFA
jgi:hypothetical protein